MKVICPEWLKSVNVGYLLPWKNHEYVRKEVTERAQGAKTSQISLVRQPSEPGTALSTEFNQTVPKALSTVFNPKSQNMFKILCIQ